DDSVQIDEEDAVADRLEHARCLRTLFDLPVQLRVLDGDAGAAGELFGEGEVVRAVAAPGLRRHEGDDAEDMVADDERDAHVALKAELAHESEVKIVDRELGDPLFGDLGDELALTSPQNVRRTLPGLGILGVAAAELECELDLAAVHVLDGKR